MVNAVDGDPTTKATWRTNIVAARRAVTPEQRATEAEALRDHLLSVAQPGRRCAPTCPSARSPATWTSWTPWLAPACACCFPLPAKTAGSPQPLPWGEYRVGGLVAAPFGLREPAPPWLPAEAIAAAAMVVVPALAVDRSGARLGRGAGFYDRSLPLADPAARLVAVVRDDELVDELPHEDHDVPMTHALTPGRGLVALGAGCRRPH